MSTQKKATPDTGSLWANAGLVGIGGFVLYALSKAAMRTARHYWNYHPWLISVAITLIVLAIAVCIFAYVWNRQIAAATENAVTEEDESSVYLGKSTDGEKLHIKQRFRTSHTQVIGTTSAGKTESVILPWAIRDIETGAGMLIIDGKSDKTFLEKFYAYVVKNSRTKDFRLFSIALPEISATFNPLAGGSAYEITERVFSAFQFENEHYRNLQYKVFHALVRLIISSGGYPSFITIRRMLSDPDLLRAWMDRSEDDHVRVELGEFLKQSERDRAENISGLDAHLSHFSSGELGRLFNAQDPQIQLDTVLRENLICYFQLPSMYYPTLASATGRMVLQCFQSAVSRRHLGIASNPQFFACYLDDFQDYIYEGFGSLLNKSRSANIGVVFSHQALGDLDKVSPAFKNVVLTNTNVKCVMRNNDPDTCEYFSRSMGTKTTEKTTERSTAGVLGETRTGERSVREVEEFKFHPNEIRSLGTGEGVVAIPHFNGVKVAKLKFARRPDIEPIRLPIIPKIRCLT